MTFGSTGRRDARLGASRLSGFALILWRFVAASAVVALFLGSLSSIAFAQDASESDTSGGTVRVRSVNAADAESSTSATDEVSTVAARDVPVAAAAVVAPSTGEIIVGFAVQYVGYPYVWAGNSPAGFDCSGFTQFVILNTLGVDIGHGLGGQPGAGAWVDAGALLPGDLVFFQNTYQAGLSHVGIYIGDGLFVHAENEGTGVVVSSIWSDYYGPRYWGAVRVG